jgi:hypothetical protein
MSGKDHFLKIFHDSRTSLSEFDKQVMQAARDIQFLEDTADCVEEWINAVPEESVNPAYWDFLAGAFKDVSDSTQSFGPMVSALSNFSAVASNTGMTVTSVVHSVGIPPHVEASILNVAIERFDRLLDRNLLIPEVKSLLRKFGLDARAGSDRSPLELFEDAVAALEAPNTPDDSPSSITLPVRHCIDDSIERLLKRQQVQARQKGRPSKISFIGQHSGKNGLTVDHFERLGFDVETLNDDLSDTKSAALPRYDAIKLFERGALFIKSLLSSVDESKLRV